MTTVLVTGARGKTGREVAAQLAARPDARVRGGSSDPRAVEIDGVEPVRFDWADEGTWGAALEGVDALYVARPEIADAPERVAALLARADGVDRVVLLSELDAENLDDGTWERRTELAVERGADNWTILRPTWFFQVLTDERYFLDAVRSGALELPSGGAAISFIDTRDIAGVAVEALLEDGHARRAYALTGPEALTLAQVAERLAAVTGYTVEHVDPPLDDVVEGLAGEGYEQWFVDYARGVYERVQAGRHGQLTDDLARFDGGSPRTLDAFVTEHAGAWAR